MQSQPWSQQHCLVAVGGVTCTHGTGLDQCAVDLTGVGEEGVTACAVPVVRLQYSCEVFTVLFYFFKKFKSSNLKLPMTYQFFCFYLQGTQRPCAISK